MPQTRSLKTLFIEAAVLVVVVAVFGHLSANFWEKYVIQSQISQMKLSLNFLKETLINIGTAYDKLHHDLKGLADEAEKKQSRILHNMPHSYFDEDIERKHAPNERRKINKYTLDRRRLHDIQVGAMIEAKNAAHNLAPKTNEHKGELLLTTDTRKVGESQVRKNLTSVINRLWLPKSCADGKQKGHYCRHGDDNACRGSI